MSNLGKLAIILPLAGVGAAAPAQPAQLDNAAVVRACVPAAVADRPLSEIAPALRATIVNCSLRGAVEQLSAQLPLRIDDVTALQAATVEELEVTYLYQVAVDAGRVTAEQRAALIQSTQSYVCGQQNMRDTISYGGSFRYIWRDPAGSEVARTVVGRC